MIPFSVILLSIPVCARSVTTWRLLPESIYSIYQSWWQGKTV